MAQSVYLLPVEPRIVELLGSAILGDSVPADWEAVAADIGILRRMRGAFLAGRPYAHEILKLNWDDEAAEISAGVGPRTFEGPDLAKVYGQLLGSTLGRLLGLTLPSWSLGRTGYSLGLLAAAELSPFQLLPLSGAQRLRARLARLGETPAGLLAAVALPGFEAGLPRLCEPFGTGLYFPPAAVREIHEALGRSGKPLTALGVKAAGRERGEAERITAAVQEAFAWAAGHGFGLLEGEEMVEADGSR
jgi:hypothetical protein